MREHRTGIVTVNWNGWADTLECLEAIFRLQEFGGPVVVVDNGSTDQSIEYIRRWAEGHLSAVPESNDSDLRKLVVPPVDKPIYMELLSADVRVESLDKNCRLFVVALSENLGFAAANNVGIRILFEYRDVSACYLINNDALVNPDSLDAVLNVVDIEAGPILCGSAIAEYWMPSVVQALGGAYRRYWGRAEHIGAGTKREHLNGLPPRIPVDYPIGAALFVNRKYIERFGWINEEYFLYYEEIDWACRAGWPTGCFVVPGSIVYHKGASATKAGRAAIDRSLLADYYIIRNRFLFARKISFSALACVIATSPMLILRRLPRSRPGMLRNALRAIADGISGKSGKKGE